MDYSIKAEQKGNKDSFYRCFDIYFRSNHFQELELNISMTITI